MKIKEAIAATGGLSAPGKMPGASYGLPAADAPWVPEVCKKLGLPVPPVWGCPIGRVLKHVKYPENKHKTVCSGCYATRNMYVMTNVRKAQVRRLVAYTSDPDQWVKGMVVLLQKEQRNDRLYFRWHDSGDLLHLSHLQDVARVAALTPKIKHWLPTRERGIVDEHVRRGGLLPRNLTIRLSAQLVDGKPPVGNWPTSTVHWKGTPVGRSCPAPSQGNSCGDCRACWDKRVRNVSYHHH